MPREPTPARLRLVDATRHLLETVLTNTTATDAELAEAADAIARVAARLGSRQRRDPGAHAPSGELERRHADYVPRSPFLGAANPCAPPVPWEVVGRRVVARGPLGAVYEGPPGYVHGGWVALGFDELLGVAAVASGQGGLTGRLSIRYRRPTPLHQELRWEAWVERIDGRRVIARATVSADGRVTAEAEGLFVAIDDERRLEYFGERVAPPEPPDPLP